MGRWAVYLALSVVLAALMPFHLPNPFKSHRGSSSVDGHVSVGYFPNWSIYQRGYKPNNVPVADLTHILYAFANINAEDGTVFLSDTWADQEIKHEGERDLGEGNLYGNFHRFLEAKKQHRHLKLLLSIGGWSYSGNFKGLGDGHKRRRFVDSAVKLLADNGLDGLDIDWEYPESRDEARVYVELLRELRQALDEYGSRATPQEPHYLLTIAAPCAPQKMETLDVRGMDQSLDFWNLMAYDFSGSWDSKANAQANLFGSELSADRAVQFFRKAGVHPSKLVLGVPLYGRGFNQTQGPGQPYGSVAPGSLEAGVYSYKELPLQGAQENFDARAGAGWSFDPSQGQLISYDTPASADAKAEYIQKQGLLGVMFWELSGDVPTHSDRSLVRRFRERVRTPTNPALSVGHECEPHPLPRECV